MKVIGITGRIGSGKSTLCRLLAERHGCVIIDADAIGHEALRDAAVRSKVVDRFGEAVLDPRGEVDRAGVALAVFGDTAALRDLESITHPWILDRIARRLAALRETDPAAIVLVDAALLLPWIGMLPLDQVVWVRASEEAALARLEARGMGGTEARARLSRQSPEDEFRRRADRVVENSGSLEELALAAEGLWESLAKTE